MIRVLMVILALGIAGPAQANSAKADKTITIAADTWCPINCTPGPHPGFGIDIARRIFEPLGYSIEYVVMPWSRALSEVRSGDVDAVIGANRNDDPTLIFPRTPLAAMTDDFYVARDSAFVFTGIDSLKNMRLGVIHAYGYSNETENILSASRATPGLVQEVTGEDALKQNVKKLIAGRIDVLIESSLVMNDRLHRLGPLAQQIKHVGSIPQGDVYLAFSQASPRSRDLARSFDKGMAQLRKTGGLEEIYKSYGVTP